MAKQQLSDEAQDDHGSGSNTDGGGRSRSAHDGGARQRQSRRAPSPGELARAAVRELAGMLGREPEGVVALERTDGGWCVSVEVVELRRIPDTADIMAEYSVDLDEDGALTGYRRAGRYTRGHTEEGS